MSASPDNPGSTPQGGYAHCILAGVILIAALALVSYTTHSALQTDSVNVTTPLTLLTSPDEIASTTTPLGTFTTGDKPGDRSIVIAADHTVQFVEFGPKGNRFKATDAIQPGHRNDTLYLTTKANGNIEVIDLSTLRYFGDVYRRTN